MKAKYLYLALIINIVIVAVGIGVLQSFRSPSVNSEQPETQTGSFDSNSSEPRNAASMAKALTQRFEENAGPAALAFPATPDDPRDFVGLTAEQRDQLKQLIARYHSQSDTEGKLEILDEIEASFYGSEFLEFANVALGLRGESDESLRVRIVEILSGNTSTDILPPLERALADSSELVRAEAAVAVGHLRGPEVLAFFAKVFEDQSADVRYAGLDSIEHQTLGNQLKILGSALGSSHADVAVDALGELEVTGSHPTIDVIIGGLGSSSPEVVEETRNSLDFLFNVEFANENEARQWWAQNRNRFDADLIEKD